MLPASSLFNATSPKKSINRNGSSIPNDSNRSAFWPVASHMISITCSRLSSAMPDWRADALAMPRPSPKTCTISKMPANALPIYASKCWPIPARVNLLCYRSTSVIWSVKSSSYCIFQSARMSACAPIWMIPCHRLKLIRRKCNK